MSRPIRPQLVASAWPPSLPRARVRMRHDGSSGRNEPGSSTRLDSQRPEAHAAGVDKSVIARGEDRVDAEGEALDHVVDESDRCGLGVFLVDPEAANPGRIVDGGVLEAPDLTTGPIDQL